jgi:C-terminal processing protease CtpA/Prc
MTKTSAFEIRFDVRRWTRRSTALLFAAALTACGGGGGGGESPPPAPPPPAPLPPSSTLANQCAPTNDLAAANLRTASLDTEKRWVRSYMDEAYLWYSEVPTVDSTEPAYSNTADAFGSLENYFAALLTPATTSSGKRKDQFSFIFSTEAWNALTQSGTVGGFGVEWHLGSPTPPRNIQVAYVDPNTPGAAAGVARGHTLISVNGVSADDNTQGGVNVLNEALSAPQLGVTYKFVLDRPSGGVLTTSLTATTITKVPVPTVSVLNVNGTKIGYLTFHDHLLPAEGQLLSAFTALQQQGATELVLDLRYNGGGFLYIASQAAYMIAGATRASNKTFEALRFNDKRVADNNDPDNNIPFLDATSGLPGSGTNAGTPLPSLNLTRLFVLAGSDTCSASEALVNALRGIDVEVVLVGATTCGKPYGFTAKDNCGISYFPVEFQGVNDKGFGDYADGFAPTCRVADDFSKPLGDPSEGMLAAALAYQATGACPPGTASPERPFSAKSRANSGGLIRHPVRASMYR